LFAPDNVQCIPTCKLVVKVHRQAEISPSSKPTRLPRFGQLAKSFGLALWLLLSILQKPALRVFAKLVSFKEGMNSKLKVHETL